jgi:hypothetical protein
MTLDINTIEENLAKAKADMEFWEKAKIVLTDPRISGVIDHRAATHSTTVAPAPPVRAYGELKKRVYGLLPAYGEGGTTTTEIVEELKADGYVFISKHPGMAVNEALNALEKDKKAYVAAKRGIAKVWTRGERKTPA